jgi:hypothetical protein
MVLYATRALMGAIPINITTSYMVLINGTPVFIEAGSLTFNDTIGKRAQASFTIKSPDTLTHYQQYQQVTIYDANNTLVFSGFITNPQEQKPGFQPSLEHKITCTDNHYLADKRIIAKSYINRTRASIVQDIASSILAQEGITVGAIVDEATNIATLYPSTSLYPSTALFPQGNNAVGVINATFAYCTVAAALDALTKDANLAGIPYYWTIDQFRQLWWVPYTYVSNSTVVDGTLLDQVTNPPTVARQNPAYRNQQYIIGGMAQTAQQTETKLGDGNATSWAMGFELASAPMISTNLNGAGYVAQSVGVKGTTGSAFYWAAGDPVIAQDSSGTKLRGPTGTIDLLQVVYVGQYPTVALANNSAQISDQAVLDASSGIVEAVAIDATITTLSDAFSKATGLLTRYGTQGIQLQWSQRGNAAGYAPGQLITVNLPDHALTNVQMLIEEVQASDQQDGFNLWYMIKAIVGAYDITWQDFFGPIVTAQQASNSITVGTSQSLTLLTPFSVALSLNATLNVSVHACPLPGATLFPSTTLYPC